MNSYSHRDWARFRDEVIRLDGGKCIRCLRSRADGVVLQVHHKAYIPNRKPWEYEYFECETLCKGCHAEEHGRIMPQSGWEPIGSDDLGGLDGNCEVCGTELRFIYLIYHPQWTWMAVGTDCCDRLTGTVEASEFLAQRIKAIGKLKRFVSSPRWYEPKAGMYVIEQKGIEVIVLTSAGKFRIYMDRAKGKFELDSLIEAKIKVFETIDSGEASRYLEKRRQKIREEKRGRQGAGLSKGVRCQG